MCGVKAEARAPGEGRGLEGERRGCWGSETDVRLGRKEKLIEMKAVGFYYSNMILRKLGHWLLLS